MDKMYEIIIVGGGPAGLASGLYAKRAGLKAVLFEKGLIGGQIAVSKEIDNYPGLDLITGFELAEKMSRHVHALGLEIVQEEVALVEPGSDYHAVRLTNGERYRAPALILAAGATVRKLGVPGEVEYFGSGVSYCATCDGFFFRDRTVAVVGGGDSAAEEALHLSRIVKKAYLIHRRDTLRAGRMLRDRILSDPKIEVVWNCVVTEIIGDGRSVKALAWENMETRERGKMPLDGVFIRIGYHPNNNLIPAAIPINEFGFVITDEKCETPIPGIFAAGDLRQKFANQIIVAAADGAIAALAAAHHVEMRKALPSA